jgi:hypothetical protein
MRCIVGAEPPKTCVSLFTVSGTGDLGQHTVGNIILTALNQQG